jgi:hypothetical protein
MDLKIRIHAKPKVEPGPLPLGLKTQALPSARLVKQKIIVATAVIQRMVISAVA